MTKPASLDDYQLDLFRVQNALDVIGVVINARLSSPGCGGDDARALFGLNYLREAASADIERLIDASDDGIDPEAPAEARAAELLDQLLQARFDYAAFGDEEPLPGEEFGLQKSAADKCEAATAAELQQLDVTIPAVALATFIYAASIGDGPLQAAGLEFDFARAHDDAGPDFHRRAMVSFIAGMERRCAGSRVVAVIAKHRKAAQALHAQRDAIAAE